VSYRRRKKEGKCLNYLKYLKNVLKKNEFFEGNTEIFETKYLK